MVYSKTVYVHDVVNGSDFRIKIYVYYLDFNLDDVYQKERINEYLMRR